jgi:hypothetical protein
MIEWFKKLIYDQSAFERYLRALLLLLAGLAASGEIDVPKWATAALMGLGGLIGAGEKNEKKP